jgi:Xaa-Pro aminopeptidase
MDGVSKRALLAASGAAVAGLAGVRQAAAASAGGKAPQPLPDLKGALDNPLLNRTRATAIMTAAGVDAMVLANPTNVYYATNRMPTLNQGEPSGSAMAVIPRDPQAPVAYIGPLFDYYYIVSDANLPPGVEPYIVFPPSADHTVASAAARGMFKDRGVIPMDAGEQHRRRATEQATGVTYATTAAAIAKALGPMAGKSPKIAVDSLDALAAVNAAAPLAATTPGEDLIRHVRLIKTPGEVALMRICSANNVAAALAAAHAVREEGTLRRVRQRFFAEAAARGNTGVFMAVDGVLAESVDRPIQNGQALLIDCVSQYAGYHGDYARTVFMGEPSASMLRVTQAIAAGWTDVRETLKPGVAFSQIHTRGVETLKKLGYDYTVSFGPHMVGLYHGDGPRRGLDGAPQDIVLEEGMIISVDCPLLDTGLGGTAHLEDLTLITATGSEPIHVTGNHTIMV